MFPCLVSCNQGREKHNMAQPNKLSSPETQTVCLPKSSNTASPPAKCSKPAKSQTPPEQMATRSVNTSVGPASLVGQAGPATRIATSGSGSGGRANSLKLKVAGVWDRHLLQDWLRLAGNRRWPKGGRLNQQNYVVVCMNAPMPSGPPPHIALSTFSPFCFRICSMALVSTLSTPTNLGPVEKEGC